MNLKPFVKNTYRAKQLPLGTTFLSFHDGNIYTVIDYDGEQKFYRWRNHIYSAMEGYITNLPAAKEYRIIQEDVSIKKVLQCEAQPGESLLKQWKEKRNRVLSKGSGF